MQMRNSANRWGVVARTFHWLIAVFVFGLLIDGYWMDHFVPRDLLLGQRHWHAIFGVYYSLLVALRILWRLANPTPAPVSGTKTIEARLMRLVHALFYLLMIAIPIAGWITWSARQNHLAVLLPGGIQIPWAMSAPDRALAGIAEEFHIYMAYTLLALAVLHIAAALWHHFAMSDSVLTRMVTGKESRAV